MNYKILLSTAIGGMFAVGTFMVCIFADSMDIAILLALLSFVLVGLALYIVLIVSEKLMNQKYSSVENRIQSTVFHKENCNFNYGQEVRNGVVYFCEKGIVIASLDKKPYVFDEFLKSEIERFEIENIRVNIYMINGRFLAITTGNAKKIMSELQNQKWI